MVYFADMADVNSKKPALERAIREWISLMNQWRAERFGLPSADESKRVQSNEVIPLGWNYHEIV